MTDPREATSQVAVVTGGASGFGLALAEELAARGMRLALLDRDRPRVEQVAASIASTHRVDAVGLGVDVADSAAIADAAAVVTDRFGRADLVVSNVGVQLFGTIDRLSDEEWNWLLDVNVAGSARIARAFLPLLRLAPHARLAFTTSSSVLAPASHMAAYQASKFAVWGLAETLRIELRDQEIDISVIFPSGMISRHLETSTEAQPAHLQRPIGAEEDFAALAASNPDMVQQLAKPEQVAPAVVDALLAGEPYVVTHGDLVDAVTSRCRALARAAEAGRDAAGPTA